MLAHDNTHGKKFYATGGSHVCSDDFFKAETLRCREDTLKAREEIKKTRLQWMALEEKALAVLDAKALCFDNNDYKSDSAADFNELLAWYDVLKENKMKKAQI